MIFFITGFLIGFSVLAWRRIDWALMFLLAALPTYVVRFQIGPLPSTFLEGMILIAFAVWSLRHTRFGDFLRGKYGVKDFLKNSPFSKKGSKETRLKYPFGTEIVLMLLVSLAAVAIAGFTSDALGIWKAYFFEPALLFILILNVFQGRKDIERIVWSLGCGALAVASWAIIQKITGLGIDNPLWAAEATRRSVSFFGYPNAIGLYLAPIIMLLLGAVAASHQDNHPFLSAYPGKFVKENYNWKSSKTKAFLAFIAVLSGLAIYYAKSDGAIVALAAAMFAVGFLGNKRTRLVVAVLAVIATLAFAAVPGAYKKIVDKLALRDFSGQVRLAQWSETWLMLKDGRIIQGAGLANYQKSVEAYHIPGI